MNRTALTLALLAIINLCPPARAATPEEIENALAKAKAYLYSKQNEFGDWETVRVRDPKGQHFQPNGWQFGGTTAVATYALLAAGESPQSPKLKPAIEFLKKAEMAGVYAVGLRCQVWHLLPQTADLKPLIRRDGKILLLAINKNGRAQGMYNYYLGDPNKQQDHSSSQYGVLGMWALEQGGLEVGTDYWKVVENAWRNTQFPDGGWCYTPTSTYAPYTRPTPSMTAAGVATLFITQDYVRAASAVGCGGNVTNDNIDRGIKWLTDNFQTVIDGNVSHPHYTWYGIERIGVASGYKYLGTYDWYATGADRIVKGQGADGSWTEKPAVKHEGTIGSTSFGMLFLARGRAPVVMNKLQYGSADPAAAAVPAAVAPAPAAGPDGKPTKPVAKPLAGAKGKSGGDWNQRPRDAANITRWIGRQAERDLNWQVVNLTRPAEELSDAPILYVAGSEGPAFTDADKAKIRTYIDNGGMVVANADCGNPGFVAAIRKFGTELFPQQEFRELPAEHVIYTDQQFPRAKWKTKPSVMSLGNGVREVVVIIPQADPAKQWQTQSDKGKEELFQLMANVFLYAVDKQGLQYKGQTHLVAPLKDAKPTRTVKVARLQYDGNWDPEPGGWRRFANVMLNEKKVGLTVEPVKIAPGALKSYKVAHLTGTTKFKLDEAARAELKSFVAAGGTLVVDAAGGSGEFAASADAELRSAFPEGAGQLDEPLKADHAIYTIPDATIGEVGYRAYARLRLTGELSGPRLRAIAVGGRAAVVFSREDLSAGLVGNQVDGIVGYDPRTATALMRNVVLYANAAK